MYLILHHQRILDNDRNPYVLTHKLGSEAKAAIKLCGNRVPQIDRKEHNMLTEAQRMKLKEKIDEKMKNFGFVSEEEMNRYPAEREEMEIPVSRGTARVIAFSYGAASFERPMFMNLHGGGFIGRHMDRDERFCRQIACTYHALVLDVDYCLAPDNPYPSAVEDCRDVLKWSIDQREMLVYDEKKLILIGHSSGGNLAAGLCMYAEEVGLPKPCALILDYPPMDLQTDPGKKQRSVCDMPAERARDYNRKYVTPERAAEPYASPLYASKTMLEGFPDTLVISAGEDSLCREDEEFALKLARSGVTVTLRRFTASVHGFVINQMCEWEEALELICKFIDSHVKGQR